MATFQSIQRCGASAFFFAAGCLLSWPSVAQDDKSAVEKLYAELATLSPGERQQRLEAGARKEGRAFLVTMGNELGRQHTALFQKRYPFLRVEPAGMGSQDKAEQFIAEETAGRHLTDAMSVAVPVLADIVRLRLIAEYPTPMTARILPQYRGFIDPQNRWLPWYVSEHGISYNSDLLKPQDAPKSWDDLCNPKYQGMMSFEPTETRFLLALQALMGEEKMKSWLECIGKNNPIFQRGHEARVRLMLAGDHAIQGENLLYAGTEAKRQQNAPFEAVYSAEVLIDAVAIVINRQAPNPHAAALYADWNLSDESQNLITAALRGAVAVKHPFIPDNAKLVTFGYQDQATVDRLHGYWATYVLKKK